MVGPAKGKPGRQEAPFPRTPQGAKPWWKIVSQVRLSLAAEALKAAIASSDEGQLSKKQKLEILAQHSTMASQNVLLVRQELVEAIFENNKRLFTEIKAVSLQVEQLEKLAEPHWKAYIEAATAIGLEPKQDGSAVWGKDEPKSLEELAGELNLPDPSLAKPEDYDQRTGFVGAVAQGGLLTIGIMGMKGVTLDRLATEPFLVALMFALCTAVMFVFSRFFKALFIAAGDHLARWKRVSDGAVPAIALLVTAPAAVLLGYGMETVIDGYGFMKILTEQSGLEAQEVAPGIIWLMGSFVSFPVLGYYAVKFFSVGYFRVFLNRLKAEQRKLRNGVDPKALGKVFEASRQLQPLLAKRVEATAKLESLQAEVRYDFNELERNRLEDLDEFSYSADMALRQCAGFEDIAVKPHKRAHSKKVV